MRARLFLLLCALLLAACSAWAQAPGSYWSGGSTTCTTTGDSVTVSISAGQLYWAWATANSSSATLTFSDSASQSATAAAGPKSQGTMNVTAEMVYVANSAAVTSVKVVSSAGTTCTLIVGAYSNMALSSALEGTAAGNIQTNTSSTTCTGPSIATTNASDVVVGACAAGNTSAQTAGGTGCSFTLEKTQGIAAAQDCNTSATGTFSSAITIATSARTIGATVPFKQAAAVTCPKTLLSLGVGC